MSSTFDAACMARALRLAEQGRYSTHPNPVVGCVIARDGRVIAEGFHRRVGGPHAEIEALRNASDETSGATAYVTLEPCSHTGRTGPCCVALAEAGITRVVAALQDPCHHVSGGGFAWLRERGIAVESGLMAAEARALNPGFLSLHERGRPWVRLKLAASLDGRTALANGASRWITGPAARRDVHRLRAASSAVVTGIDTVLADDPALTVRDWPLDTLAGRQPARVVLDSRGRLPARCRLLDTVSDGEALLWVTGPDVAPRADAEQTVCATGQDGRLDLALVLQELGRRDLHTLLFECGARLGGALIADGLVDELVVYMAPALFGGDGRALALLRPFAGLADVPRFALADVRQCGPDLRLTLHPHTAG